MEPPETAVLSVFRFLIRSVAYMVTEQAVSRPGSLTDTTYSTLGYTYTVMSVSITYFVHGTTTDNEQDIATGWLPGELSEVGKEQAKKLGDQIADKHFDVVFCSDLQRAIDSAELGFGRKYEIIQDERLRECNYGDMNGKSATSFKNKMGDFVNAPFPNGESYKDVEARLAGFVDFLRTNYDGKHIAIVAHQGPQLALDVLLRGKTWQQAIDEDWRKKKAWQPGWEYEIS